MEKYYEGEDESLPLIFEAIIKRKLAGIPDDKLIEQLNLESPTNGFEDKEFDFDFEDKWSETDEDGDDLDWWYVDAVIARIISNEWLMCLF